MKLLACVAVLFLTVVACKEPNVPSGDADAQAVDAPAPSPDGVEGAPCLRMCAHLAALGCPEAFPEAGTCEGACERVVDGGESPLDPDCVAKAPTIAAVRACPAMRCLGK